MGRFDGKVAFITGAARGQGRSHAVRFAEEGADVIALDICAPIDTVSYPLATAEDLVETVGRVEELGRRMVAAEADVRDHNAVKAAFGKGLAELGRVDFVIANAGIGAIGFDEPDPVRSFLDAIHVNLLGTWNTVRVALPTLVEQGQGGSIVIISSTAGLKGIGGVGGGGEGYTASKHGVVGLMRSFATNYAQHNIRVNTVHPTGVATPMVLNAVIGKMLAECPEKLNIVPNLLPVELLDPGDVTDTVLFLCSPEARWITGVALPVDAGLLIR
jgi:SDR family mycofactocin-dependent oxidoreductase